MFRSQLGRVLWRRRRLVLAVVLLSLLAGVGAFLTVGPNYELKAEVLLLPPARSLPANTNPYLQLGDVTPAVTVLAAAMNDSSTTDALARKGLNATYTLTQDPFSPAPLLLMDVQARDPGTVAGAENLLLERIPLVLADLQRDRGLTADNRIISTVVTKTTHPSAVRKSQIRLAVVAVLGPTVVGIGLLLMIDLILLRRRRRDGAATGGPAPEQWLGAQLPIASGSEIEGAPALQRNEQPVSRPRHARDGNGAPPAKVNVDSEDEIGQPAREKPRASGPPTVVRL